MFTLIITIIAIALVTVTVLTTVWYGGTAFSKGRTDAAAARAVSEGQQIAGAYTLSQNQSDPFVVDELSDLVTGSYLASVPASWSFVAGTPASGSNPAIPAKAAFTLTDAAKVEICTKVNARAGLTAATVAAADIKNFGCDTTDNKVYFALQ